MTTSLAACDTFFHKKCEIIITPFTSKENYNKISKSFVDVE